MSKRKVVKTHYEDGSLNTETEMRNGKKHGLEKEYYKDKLRSSTTYFDDVKHGFYKEYKDGVINFECYYVNGSMLMEYFYDNKGNLEQIEYMIDKVSDNDLRLMKLITENTKITECVIGKDSKRKAHL
ncbi:hypothetical protein [Sulfurimonas sp.]|uniref:toxin-antitoxin system YwqK family antitoxin n=1 Tax=Sulfurimonas sp. TaxID=2022749 RepID=UPI002B486264|nr:hypothetical protein [Sulfurimonas sp.]